MKNYSILKKGSTKSIEIQRVSFSHILLVHVTDNVKPVVVGTVGHDKIDLAGEGKKSYLLMKKSGKSRWQDLSFYNFNQDNTLAGLSIPVTFDTVQKLNTEQHNDMQKEIKEHLTYEYKICGDVLHVRPLEYLNDGAPVYYLQKSATTGQNTLYIFYFYGLESHIKFDGSLFNRLLRNQRERILGTFKEDRCGLFSGKAEYEGLLPNGPKNVEEEKNAVDLLNDFQIDQVNELITRNTSVLLPLDFLRRDHISNLHTNFRLHSIVYRVLEEDINSDFSSLARNIKPFQWIPARKATTCAGVILLDLVDFKRLFNENNLEYSKDLAKAFQGDVAQIIHKHSGYVYKTGGDSFLAMVHRDSGPENAESLLKMALEIQKLPWQTRIGLNVIDEEQPLYEGHIGPPELGEYDLSGPGLNIAARLEHKIKELKNHGILISAHCIAKEDLEKILIKFNGFTFKEKQLSDIPEKPGSNPYYYIYTFRQ